MQLARLVVFVPLVLSSLLTAAAPERSTTPSLRVLTLGRYAPFGDTILKTVEVVHTADFRPGKTVHVTSVWTVEDLAPARGSLVLGFDEAEGAALGRVEIDGRNARLSPLTGHEHFVAVDIPKGARNGRATISIKTDLADREPADGLHVLAVYRLPKIARLVQTAGRPGWDLRPMSRHSYGDAVTTGFQVSHPAAWLAVGSTPSTGGAESGDKASPAVRTTFAPLASGRFVVVLAARKYWQTESFESAGSTYTLLSRIHDAVLEGDLVRELVGVVAPRLTSRFGMASPHVVLVDADWASVSGGLLGNNVIGFFAKAALTAEDKAELKAIFGKEASGSTRSTIEDLYSGDKAPWRAYMTGMMAHELAHLYFGFGRTTERISELQDLWLSLGLGLVYDEQVTKEVIGRRDVFLEAVEQRWRTVYAVNSHIDQRLVHPDTKNDAKYGLSRAHVYAHGKALAVLRALRERIGGPRFDAAVLRYLTEGCEQMKQGHACAKVGGYGALHRYLVPLDRNLAAFENVQGL